MIAIEDPGQEAVVALIRQSDAYMAALYPAESNHLLDVESLKEPDIRFFVARRGEAVVGCAALRLEDGYAELKRMFVDPQARGLRIGQALLEGIERFALSEGVDRICLETGGRQPEALGLYRKSGYREATPEDFT